MLLTDSSRYGCTSLSYRWSLCLCTLSAVKFTLPLILLTTDHCHICVSVTHFSSECLLIRKGLIRVLKLHQLARLPRGAHWKWEHVAAAVVVESETFSTAVSESAAFFLTCRSQRTARWTAQEVEMRLVAADRVASPRKEQSQQSNLLTALRCVSGQVLLSAIPQVLIYQLSVQTEHRPRLYFCLLL